MAKRSQRGISVGWVIASAVVLEFMFILLFVPSARVAHYNTAERSSVAAELGTQAEGHVLASANEWFRTTLIDTGMTRALNEYLFGHYTPEISDPNHAVSNYARDRVSTFWRMLYTAYYRLALLWLWVPYLLPLAIPVFIDAHMERRVRQWRFSFVSPMTRSLAARIGTVFAVVLGVSFMIPLHVPPLVYPFLFGALLMAVWMWVANLQKRI